jgi:hypothetical protein
MDKRVGKRRFKEPREYIRNIIFLYTINLGALVLFITLLSKDEQEIYEIFANQDISGTSGHRRRQLFQIFLIRTFGKNGLIVLMVILILLFLIELFSEISAYRRYKHKCKLYHEGIIKNFFDIYDDGSSFSILRGIKHLFHKKKNKYPSKKQARKAEKEIEEYFKDK